MRAPFHILTNPLHNTTLYTFSPNINRIPGEIRPGDHIQFRPLQFGAHTVSAVFFVFSQGLAVGAFSPYAIPWVPTVTRFSSGAEGASFAVSSNRGESFHDNKPTSGNASLLRRSCAAADPSELAQTFGGHEGRGREQV